jgi:uncharacterized protein YecE (DUF72 family)
MLHVPQLRTERLQSTAPLSRRGKGKAGDVRIGVSGWLYKGWRGHFYPKKLRQKDELAYVGETFDSVEINGTFYSTQAPQSFRRWAEVVPEGFCFAVKGPRYLTHMLRLTKIETPLANFFASGVLLLGPKMGPILWQFPPRFRFNADRFDHFLSLLPRDTQAAAALSRKHDDRVRKGFWTETDATRRVRHAVEIRDESFLVPEFVQLLRRHNVALVIADTVDWPCVMDATADFVYCRLHGSEELYKSNYDHEALNRWTRRVVNWATAKPITDGKRIVDEVHAREQKPRDVYLYFDNTDKLRAPGNALDLTARVARKLRRLKQ